MKKSFSLVEIIFVIVVLSIVAGGTFDYILGVFRVYVRANSIDTMQNDLDIALTEISNRLSYRIKDSVIYGGTATPLFNAGVRNGTLEWIGYDGEGMMGMWDDTVTVQAVMPGWSGFIDRGKLTPTTLLSLGSNLDFANQIITELSNNKVTLSNSRAVLIIPRENKLITSYGWYQTTTPSPKSYFIINGYSDSDSGIGTNYNIFNGTDFDDITDTDRYYLSWSAYALELNASSKHLNFYYNYQPWNNETYQDGNRALMLKNVIEFSFWQNGNSIWIKLCVDSNNTDTISERNKSLYGFCKERVVY